MLLIVGEGELPMVWMVQDWCKWRIVWRGITIPRYIEQQAGEGKFCLFLEEAQPGDLAFFGDSSGVLPHVGILWEQGRIIHASGKVRVDKIDHHGIFNEDLKRYTHTLKVVRQIFLIR